MPASETLNIRDQSAVQQLLGYENRLFVASGNVTLSHGNLKRGVITLSLICVGQRKFAHRSVELII